jgi:hypothetical protein
LLDDECVVVAQEGVLLAYEGAFIGQQACLLDDERVVVVQEGVLLAYEGAFIGQQGCLLDDERVVIGQEMPRPRMTVRCSRVGS